MRIAMLAAGSRGDYQPVLAVARGLRARGHDVGVTVTSDYVDLVEAAGVTAEEVPVDVMGYYHDHLLDRGMPVGLTEQMAFLGQVTRAMAPAVRETLSGMWSRYDAVVTTAMSAAWPAMVDGGRTPQVLMMFLPVVPTLWGDASLYAVRGGRSVANLLAGVRALRASSALVTDVPGVTGAQRRRALAQLATVPMFVANSPQVVTPRRVAGRRIRCTGYPFLDAPAGTGLPREVADFLAVGPEPVYAGLGSHTVPAVRDALRHTVDAALALGHRAIVQRGSGLEGDGPYAGDRDRVLFVGDVPHELLFPRVAAVVHHGGAGTTAQALRAGRPQVVLPFTMDQPFFGRRVHEIGVGAAPVPAPEASRQRIGSALHTALGEQVADRARTVGRVVRGEDGVGGAAALIEDELRRRR